MSVIEEKRIVIRLPRFSWSSFLNLRFGVAIALIFCATLFSYWYHSIRPYLWITAARVESFSSVISSDLAGRIVEMGPQEGERVNKGQLLFVLDRDLILAKLRQAQSSIDSLNEQIRIENTRMEKAMNEYLSSSAQLEMGIGSPDSIEKQLAILEDAQTKTERAASQLALAETEFSFLDLQAKKMILTSPFDGIVMKRTQNPGAVISFAQPVYVLSDPARVWIEAEVPENQIGQIEIGSPVRIRLSAYPKKEWNGQVCQISPATVSKIASLPFSSQNETVAIKISLEKTDISLKPGLSAQVGLKVH